MTIWLRCVAAVALGLGLTACSDPTTVTSAPPTETPRGPICPGRLPVGDDPDGFGFGVSAYADEAPSLPRPERAWTCRYASFDDGTNDDGAHLVWERRGAAVQVEPGRLPALAAALAALAPLPTGEEGWGCTSELGFRWVVVTEHEAGRAGIVVDDYGCREVRLTDEPWTTPPGKAAGASGVLGGGADVLAALGVG